MLEKIRMNNVNEKIVTVQGIIDLATSHTRLYVEGREVVLEDTFTIGEHSPGGFSWGYSGSGPLQTAIGVLMQVLPEAEVEKIYEFFANSYVCKWGEGNFQLELNVDKAQRYCLSEIAIEKAAQKDRIRRAREEK